ncbi:MAG: AAA family ATPase, partial [Thermodesulfobacteriota bacterium]
MTTPAPDVRQRERFVGRGRELRALKAHLAAADAGRGSVVLIGGDAGVGKTRLVEELLTMVAPRRVLWGRCRAGEGAPAYWPWRQIVTRYVEGLPPGRLRADLGDGAADLARLVPAIRASLGVAPRDAIPGDEQGRFRLLDAVAELLARASAEELLAVVVDDLHAADLESLLLLRHLGGTVGESRLLVLATYRELEMRRTSQAARLLGDIARVSQRIVLGGLAEDEVAAFSRNVLADLSSTLVSELHRATDGNPFFVKQVMALLQRDGWEGSGRVPIPFEVRAAVRRRLDPLSPAVRWLLAQAAVLGREFELTVLARLVELSGADVLGMLAEPLALGLVAEADEPVRFRFTHALVAQTLYDDLPAADRASLHRAAAGALEATSAGAADFAAVAHHYHLSVGRDAVEKAVQFSVRAAEQARELLGYEEACGHYERALVAQRSLGAPSRRRLPLLLDFADVQALAGDVDGLRATCLEAARLAREHGEAEALARAALTYGRVPSLQSDDPTQIALLEEALAALPPRDSVLRARLHARLVLATYYGGAAERRAQHGREAVAIARRLGDAATEAVALRCLYHAYVGTPDPSARVAILEEAIRAAELSGAVTVACDARIDAVSDYLELGDVVRADRALAAAEEL